MREILFKAKSIEYGEWIEGIPIKTHLGLFISFEENPHYCSQYGYIEIDDILMVDEKTLCKFTGLYDKNGNKIWENDILMCHENPEDLVKVAFGEFGVRNIETGSIVDEIIGWYYEIIPTDAISRCEPFFWSMPLTEYYIDRCEMEVVGNIFDNKELLQEESDE